MLLFPDCDFSPAAATTVQTLVQNTVLRTCHLLLAPPSSGFHLSSMNQILPEVRRFLIKTKILWIWHLSFHFLLPLALAFPSCHHIRKSRPEELVKIFILVWGFCCCCCYIGFWGGVGWGVVFFFPKRNVCLRIQSKTGSLSSLYKNSSKSFSWARYLMSDKNLRGAGIINYYMQILLVLKNKEMEKCLVNTSRPDILVVSRSLRKVSAVLNWQIQTKCRPASLLLPSAWSGTVLSYSCSGLPKEGK